MTTAKSIVREISFEGHPPKYVVSSIPFNRQPHESIGPAIETIGPAIAIDRPSHESTGLAIPIDNSLMKPLAWPIPKAVSQLVRQFQSHESIGPAIPKAVSRLVRHFQSHESIGPGIPISRIDWYVHFFSSFSFSILFRVTGSSTIYVWVYT